MRQAFKANVPRLDLKYTIVKGMFESSGQLFEEITREIDYEEMKDLMPLVADYVEYYHMMMQ
jgi:hypothetical protein